MPKYLGKYQLGNTIKKGTFSKVKIGKDESGNRYAIKILKKDEYSDLIKTEVESLQHLKHPNIINIIEVSSGQIKNVNKPHKSIFVEYIVLELARGGQLFDIVENSGRLSENVARFYFAQLMEVLNYMHNTGVCHRNLSAAQILLDSEFDLKIVGFGFSKHIKGTDGKG